MTRSASPEIRQSAHMLEGSLAAVVEEMTAKLKAGETVDLEQYAEAYPSHAEELKRLYPTLRLLADLSASDPASICPPAPGEEEFAAIGELGDFRLIREIGRGGMGVVYEAEQISLGRCVALKVLPFAGALDARQLQRFKNEAQAAGHLHHTNIVPVHFVGCERGVHFYAMQLIEGETLAQAIAELRSNVLNAGEKSGDQLPTATFAPALEQARSQIEAPTAVALTTEHSITSPAFFRMAATLGIQAAEALEYAHQMGVVHRDIKPANLLVTGEQGVSAAGVRLWITDFGLAQFHSEANLTLTGDLLGTLRYMSPEQALAKRVVIDHRTDIYSLGVTLYELLTLEPAITGKDRQELLQQIASGTPRRQRLINKSIPPELETIVGKAMEKNAADRYGTAQELADDLRRFLEDRPIRARRPNLRQRLAKWGRRHTAVVRAGVVVLALATVGSAISAVMIGQERDVAQANLLKAEANFEKAEEQRRWARRAVDEMYTQVAEKWLAGQPRLTTVQREFLEKALHYYEQFALTNDADPKSRLEKANAYARVGKILTSLGQHDKAIAAFSSALSLFEELTSTFPGEADYWRERAACQSAFGLLLSNAARWPEAKDAYFGAIRSQEHLIASFPGKPADLHMLARFRSNLSGALAPLGQWDELETALQAAIDLGQRLVEEFPENTAYRIDLGGALHNLTFVMRHRGDHRQARQFLERAITHQQAALQSDPRDLVTRVYLCNHYAMLTEVLTDLKDPEQAINASRQGILLAEQLVSDNPDAPGHRIKLANGLFGLGVALRSTNNVRQAKKEFLRAIEILERLPDNIKDLLPNQELRWRTYNALAKLNQAEGRLEDAVRGYRTAIQLLPPEGAEVAPLVNLAWIQAQWALLEKRNPSEAVAVAKQAVQRAPKNAACWLILGVAYYREGDFKSSVAALEKSRSLHDEASYNWFFLAMATWKLGDREQAHLWYDKAVAWMDKNQPKSKELQVFRAEAEEVVGVGKK